MFYNAEVVHNNAYGRRGSPIIQAHSMVACILMLAYLVNNFMLVAWKGPLCEAYIKVVLLTMYWHKQVLEREL